MHVVVGRFSAIAVIVNLDYCYNMKMDVQIVCYVRRFCRFLIYCLAFIDLLLLYQFILCIFNCKVVDKATSTLQYHFNHLSYFHLMMKT